ncbi:hypothetical protein [Acidisoma sp. S159]|jgi:hypothetical protein|uniref:hypothetical protein n=1 Tax=Acidisoma sp. S159 TaxID=1747225 RepID=UPI00131D9F3A|nr:hypothetical protein [Acidisoma sp. S159]
MLVFAIMAAIRHQTNKPIPPPKKRTSRSQKPPGLVRGRFRKSGVSLSVFLDKASIRQRHRVVTLATGSSGCRSKITHDT